jgi:hypothetical protein
MDKYRSILGEYLVVEVQDMRLAVSLVVHESERVDRAALLVVRLDE